MKMYKAKNKWMSLKVTYTNQFREFRMYNASYRPITHKTQRRKYVYKN